MPYQEYCPMCHQLLIIPDGVKEVSCPICGAILEIEVPSPTVESSTAFNQSHLQHQRSPSSVPIQGAHPELENPVILPTEEGDFSLSAKDLLKKTSLQRPVMAPKFGKQSTLPNQQHGISLEKKETLPEQVIIPPNLDRSRLKIAKPVQVDPVGGIIFPHLIQQTQQSSKSSSSSDAPPGGPKPLRVLSSSKEFKLEKDELPSPSTTTIQSLHSSTDDLEIIEINEDDVPARPLQNDQPKSIDPAQAEIEILRKEMEEARKRIEEEMRQLEEARKKAEEELRRVQEEARRQAELDAKRILDEARRQALEFHRQQEIEAAQRRAKEIAEHEARQRKILEEQAKIKERLLQEAKERLLLQAKEALKQKMLEEAKAKLLVKKDLSSSSSPSSPEQKGYRSLPSTNEPIAHQQSLPQEPVHSQADSASTPESTDSAIFNQPVISETVPPKIKLTPETSLPKSSEQSNEVIKESQSSELHGKKKPGSESKDNKSKLEKLAQAARRHKWQVTQWEINRGKNSPPSSKN